MKAIILNSGIGKRMGSLTTKIPKCMIKLYANETILKRQLRLLQENGIKEAIITTGPFKEKLEFYAKSHTKIKVRFVHNPFYAKTNYIYSMHLFGKNSFTDDTFLLLHGDLVFGNSILENILENDEGVLIDFEAELPKKDFKARLTNNNVKKIGTDLFGPDCKLCLPFYKLSKRLLDLWLEEIDKFIQDGKTDVYAENALNEILKDHTLKAIPVSNGFCSEIDTPEDLKFVKKYLGRINNES